MYIAAICSFPGGFDVLILMRSASQPRASFAIAEVSPDGNDLTAGFPAGIPGLSGATCAATGKPAAIDNAAIPANTWTKRFQFTNPSSSSNMAAARPLSKRFDSNVLHTNMQVRALGWGNAVGLLKLNRFPAASFPACGRQRQFSICRLRPRSAS